MIIGTTTEEFTIFAACDSVYLRDHAKSLVASCAIHNNNVHIHVTNPNDYDIKYLNYLSEGYKILNKNCSFTSSYDNIDITGYNRQKKLAFYASNRFLVAQQVINSNVLIVDVDCFLMNHIEDQNCDVGIYLRENSTEKEWGGLIAKCAAGAVYVAKDKFIFLETIKNFILQNEMISGVDQVAVYKAYLNHNDLKYKVFDKKFMDWEFKAGSKIWTGKGNRKILNHIYGQQLKFYKKKFPLNEKDFIIGS